MKIFTKRIFCLFLVMLLMTGVISLTGCTLQAQKLDVTGYKLNTYVQITAYSKANKDILNQALNLCDKYEMMFSRTSKDSILYKVNHGELHEIPAEVAELIQYGIHYSYISNGAFDLTIGSVSQLWDFTAEDPQVPDQNDIDAALPYINYKNVVLTPIEGSDSYRIDMPEGTVIDLGAIAKGYIADRIKDFLIENGVTRAVINLGGNVLCVGSKSSTEAFTIGVKKPFTQTGENVAILQLNDYSAVSSGVYERYFYKNDQFYHHILNPATGYPYQTNLTEVTILSPDSVTGDCLSTTCFVLGLDDGMKLIESINDVEAIFVTSDGALHYSSGASQYLSK